MKTYQSIMYTNDDRVISTCGLLWTMVGSGCDWHVGMDVVLSKLEYNTVIVIHCFAVFAQSRARVNFPVAT